MTQNLMDGLLDEIERVSALRQLYLQVPMGHIAATLMGGAVAQAKAAITDGDTVAMLRLYRELKEYSE